ncbi:MAG TPA: head-tail adaptor protein, partial [Asticcacaulis sp.]|nr:head-tail adaptor protein [Asticcacaulis sp.]
SAGELRHAIKIQRREETDDGYGNTTGAWVDFITRRACSLLPTRGGEQVIAARAQGTALYDCWVRFDSQTSSITPDDRAVDTRDANRVFNIKFAQDMDGRRAFILLQLEQGVATG